MTTKITKDRKLMGSLQFEYRYGIVAVIWCLVLPQLWPPVDPDSVADRAWDSPGFANRVGA